MDLSIIYEEDLSPESPEVESTAGNKCKCDMNEERILRKLSAKYNSKLSIFFNDGVFHNQLQALVKNELNDMALNESSAHNTTMLDCTQNGGKSDDTNVEDRLLTLESNVKRLLDELGLKNQQLEEKNDQNNELLLKIKKLEAERTDEHKRLGANTAHENIQESIENLQLDSAAVKADITVLKKFEKELDHFKNEVFKNEVLSKEIAIDTEMMTNTFINIESQLKNLFECKEEMKKLHDDLEQYGRRDILEFWGIGQRDGENTTYVVLDFLDSVLGLKLSKYDISVSHRQRQPRNANDNERRPDPIYVKFVNRSVKSHILYLKRKLYKRMKQTEVFIHENLTLRRRELLATAKRELQNFKFIWVREGSIFVCKYSNSRVHKIEDFHTIEKLSKAAT